MTAEKKQKVNFWATQFFRLLVTAFMTLAVIKVPEILAEIKNLTFDSIDDKINTKNLVNTVTPKELEKIKDHTIDPGIHMPKEAKDSVYVTRNEFEELMKNTVIDQYNMKRGIDEILETQKAMRNENARSLEIINYRIDHLEK